MNCPEVLNQDCKLINQFLADYFYDRPEYGKINESMSYSLNAGGKRIRPVLTMEVYRMMGGVVEDILPIAASIEMIHTYSLIHDDLPCMDNDDLRRGMPTNHILFGEAGATLAGDGLLTEAFFAISNCSKFDSNKLISSIQCLAKNAGAMGMVGGQCLDIEAEDKILSEAELINLQNLKTGALICASVEIGCILGNGTKHDRECLTRYASCIGLAFQIQDDILDVTGTEEILGKPIGSDENNKKNTFVSNFGVDECIKKVKILTNEAKQSISHFKHNDFLIWLADYLASRTN